MATSLRLNKNGFCHFNILDLKRGREIRGRSQLWDGFLQHWGELEQTHHEHVVWTERLLLWWQEHLTIFRALPTHCLVSTVLQAPGGHCTHSFRLHLISICLTKAGLFPRWMENTREWGELAKGAAEVAWLPQNHFISLSRSSLGLPPSTQTCLCSYNSNGKLPFRIELASETLKGNVAFYCAVWNARYLILYSKANS